MSKFIIYDSQTGKVWRDLDKNNTESDGTILEVLKVVNTLRYPHSVNPSIIEITNGEFDSLDEHLDKYLVQDGKIVEGPDWKTYNPNEEITEE